MRSIPLALAKAIVLAGGVLTAAAADQAPQPGTAEDVRRLWEEDAPSTRAARVITAEEIWRSNARDLPELLQREAGLWTTFATYAGGTPIVRGLTANDVLIMLDGLKVNNTAYRFGPLEYLTMIDLHKLERIEIIRGAAGRYGGDTHGPVIRLFTKRDARPLAPGASPPDDPTARAYLRYSTVDKATVAHLEAHHEGERYGFLFGASSRDIGDLRGGDQTNFQRVTAYEETGGSTRLQVFVSDRQTLDLDIQVLEQTNVERFDRIQSGSHLDYRLSPRKRSLFRISYFDSVPRAWAQRLEASIYVNEQRQRAIQQLAGKPEEILQSSDNNDVEGVQLALRSVIGERHSLNWGAEWMDEVVSAVRRRLDTLTGEELVRGTDPTRGGQSRTQLTLWVEDRIDLHPKLELSIGGRYSQAEVKGTQATPIGEIALDMDDGSFSAFCTAGWSLTESLDLLASFDHGSLLPGIDEVTSFTDDPDLEGLPSSTLAASAVDSFEIGLRYSSERLRAAVFVFRQELDDVTVLEPVTIDGLPFDDGDGDGVQGPDEASWARGESAGRSEIDGLELDFAVDLPLDLDLFGFFRASQGDDSRTRTPLAGQPPDFGLLGLGWRGSGRWEPWVEGVVRWADDKRRLAPADPYDPSFDPAWLESFSVFELRGGVTLPSRARLTLTLDNPSDKDYRRFGSAIAGAGRNLVLTAEFVF